MLNIVETLDRIAEIYFKHISKTPMVFMKSKFKSVATFFAFFASSTITI